MKNLNGYIKKLEKGMEDKLFFLRDRKSVV